MILRHLNKFKISIGSIAIVFSISLLFISLLGYTFSFFTDLTGKNNEAIAGNVDITQSNVFIEKKDTIDNDDTNDEFSNSVPIFTTGDVNTFKWTVTLARDMQESRRFIHKNPLKEHHRKI